MFKSLTKKLATIPTPRNSTLQPPQENVVTAPDSFQELIAAEELILNSYVRPSAHAFPIPTPPVLSLRGLNTGFGQAIEAWKTCIGSEDEDLKVRSAVVLSPKYNSSSAHHRICSPRAQSY